jgi:predicted enzyme related to lactoylglutathione lyase
MASTEVRAEKTSKPARLQVYEIVMDCQDPPVLGRFWADVLSYEIAEEDADVTYIEDPQNVGPAMCFNKVDETKTSKNRLHLDLNVDEDAMENEIERLTTLGARRVNIGQNDETFWAVLADPEGNEFCLVC